MRSFVLLLALLCVVATAAYSAAPRRIELRAKIVDPSSTQSLLDASVKRDSLPMYSETGLYLVQARGRVTPRFRAALAETIGRHSILQYIPRDTLLVRASLAELEALSAIPEARPEVHWVGPYDTEFKLAPSLAQLQADDIRDQKGRIRLVPNVIIALVEPHCPEWVLEDPCINFTVRAFEREPFFSRKARKFDVTFRAVSNSTLRFECGRSVPACLDFLIDWLSHRHEVLWLEAQPIPFASLSTATPSIFFEQEPFTPARLVASSFNLLNGEGQVVSIADTGVDVTSCFFSDPNNPVGPNHRKVLDYIPYADSSDIRQGHGTAVAGCFVGNCEANTTTSQFNGVAPKAKIIVFDISNTVADPTVDYGGQPLTLPGDLKDVYTPLYAAGSRIHVDSWGGDPQSEATTSTQQLDEFMWYHRDFLNVRAAGNDGAHYFSISTQAVAKNVLTVGAVDTTLNAYLLTLDYLDLTGDVFTAQYKNCPINSTVCNITTEAECCATGLDVMLNACCLSRLRSNALGRAAQYNTSVIASFSSKGPTRDQRVKPDVLAIGNRVVAPMALGNTNYTLATPNPDSSTTSNLFTIAGTSFSAPLMAGAATIVRQYFMDGYYPDGFVGGASKVPSSALIKAMLITAATPVTYFVNTLGVQTVTGGSLIGASWEAGFGKVSLENALYFNGSSFSLLILEGEVVTNETVSICFELPAPYCDATVNQEITATLVWTDYPAFPASVRQLVNDLDLVFVRSDKSGAERVFYGNRPYDTITLEATRDTLNTVERVTVNVTHCPATFRVNVTGFDVPGACDSKNRNCRTQDFALVVRGPVGMEQATKCVECESGSPPLSCAVDNGVGEKRCKKGKYTKCFVSACDKGYTINSYTNKCRAFLSYYVVVGIASGAFIFITAVICTPIEFMYRWRRRGSKGARSAADLNRVGFWDVFEVIEPRLLSMVIGSVCSLIGTSCSLIQPLFIADLFEQLQTVTEFSKIISLFYLIILFVVLEFVFSALGDFIIGVGTEGLLRHLRDRLYDGIIHRNYSELEGLDKGELRSRVMLDPQLVITFPSTALVVIFSGLVKIVVGIILIFLISWSLSLVFLAVVPFLAVIAIVYAWLIQPRITEQLDLLNATSAISNEGFSNLRVVKMYHKEDDETWRFVQANNRFYRRAMKNIILNDGANTIKSFLMQALAVGLLWYGSVLVIKPEITSGLLLAFFLYVGLAAAGVLSFSGVWPSYTTTLGALTRILELADQLNLAKARERAAEKDTTYKRMKKLMRAQTNKSVRVAHRDPDRTTGNIGMDNVSFKYASFSDQWILKDLSMNFEIGKSHAIIGPSGAGKTSIFNLLTRLYEPNSGTISLDGVDVAGMSQEELLKYIGVVEQAPRVFHRSLWDNITYSKPNATADEVDEVCRVTNCTEFISKMPNGYDTVIGEDSGEVLSGGQKQRLTLARALLKNPRVLLLDEPTSELDVENAQIITDLILSTAKERTVIFITHSLATCRKADKIFFLQSGQVMESGSHDELMAKRGSYFNFIQISFAMAAENEDADVDKKSKRAGRILDLPTTAANQDELVTAQLLLATSPRFKQVASSANFGVDRAPAPEEAEERKDKERKDIRDEQLKASVGEKPSSPSESRRKTSEARGSEMKRDGKEEKKERDPRSARGSDVKRDVSGERRKTSDARGSEVKDDKKSTRGDKSRSPPSARRNQDHELADL